MFIWRQSSPSGQRNKKQVVNENIEYHHSKMNSIDTILSLISKDCFMVSIDLKDAYCSVKISEKFQQYLIFEFLDSLYKFVCFPNVLALYPRKFNKITKVVLSDLKDLEKLRYQDILMTSSQKTIQAKVAFIV